MRALFLDVNGGLLCSTESVATMKDMAQRFDATLSLVEVERGEVPTLSQIMRATKGGGIGSSVMHERPRVVEELFRPKSKPRSDLTIINAGNYTGYLSQAEEIQEYIKAELTSGRGVSLKVLQDWTESKGITLSKGGMSRHLQKVLNWALERGYQKEKVGSTYLIKMIREE